MKKTTTNTKVTEEIKKTATLTYEDAEKAVYIALKARHEKSGLQFLAQLQNMQKADTVNRNNTTLAEQIAELEQQLIPLKKEHKELANLKTYALNQTKRVTLTNNERTTWATQAQAIQDKIDTLKSRIKPITDNIDNIYDKLSETLSDRSDIVQDVCLWLVNYDAQDHVAEYNDYLNNIEDDSNVMTYDEYVSLYRFKGSINCAGRAISHLATPDAMNRTTTKSHKATTEELAQWQQIHGNNMGTGYKVPVPTRKARLSDVYDTLEYKDTKTQHDYYIIRHWTTVAPYQYIGNYTEDGETDVSYIKSYNPFVANYNDVERIEELATLANLTDREKMFLNEFAKYCRYEGNFQKCKEYAFKRIGITSKTNQTTFFNRMKKKLQNR